MRSSSEAGARARRGRRGEPEGYLQRDRNIDRRRSSEEAVSGRRLQGGLADVRGQPREVTHR